ncbi:MAG: hypothetical protein MHPSP_002403 [Paramarteilia canceri]
MVEALENIYYRKKFLNEAFEKEAIFLKFSSKLIKPKGYKELLEIWVSICLENLDDQNQESNGLYNSLMNGQIFKAFLHAYFGDVSTKSPEMEQYEPYQDEKYYEIFRKKMENHFENVNFSIQDQLQTERDVETKFCVIEDEVIVDIFDFFLCLNSIEICDRKTHKNKENIHESSEIIELSSDSVHYSIGESTNSTVCLDTNCKSLPKSVKKVFCDNFVQCTLIGGPDDKCSSDNDQNLDYSKRDETKSIKNTQEPDSRMSKPINPLSKKEMTKDSVPKVIDTTLHCSRCKAYILV